MSVLYIQCPDCQAEHTLRWHGWRTTLAAFTYQCGQAFSIVIRRVDYLVTDQRILAFKEIKNG